MKKYAVSAVRADAICVNEIPVWIAAYGPKALATAGEYADGVILQIAEPGLVTWFIDQCHEAATAAGSPTARCAAASGRPLSTMGCTITTRPSQAVERSGC